jgi:FkbM family methyltransferase
MGRPKKKTKDIIMLIPFQQVIQSHNLNPKNVIHIGAHYGQEAEDYYANGVESSFWIEANPSVMEILESNLKKYPNAYATCACLSDQIGEVNFNIANNEQSSSMLDLAYHKVVHKEVEYSGSIKLTTTTLNALFMDMAIPYDHFDFLNADIQGAELLMLKGATHVLPYLKCLYLEVNKQELYKGCALIGDLDDFLKEYGFERKETVWCGDFGWGDAVYIKK